MPVHKKKITLCAIHLVTVVTRAHINYGPMYEFCFASCQIEKKDIWKIMQRKNLKHFKANSSISVDVYVKYFEYLQATEKVNRGNLNKFSAF